ncbi:MAG: hypothetical protein ACI90U_002673 [Pseudomonadales bacterium]|jgi:hypothetical protein
MSSSTTTTASAIILATVMIGYTLIANLAPALSTPVAYDLALTELTTSAQNSTALKLSSIADLHPFGKAESVKTIKAPKALPTTNLDLRLVATFVKKNSENSSALIAIARNTAKLFLTQDTIADGVTLHEVFSDRVTIKRDDAFETLLLPTAKALASNKNNNAHYTTPTNQPTVSTPAENLGRNTSLQQQPLVRRSSENYSQLSDRLGKLRAKRDQ